MERYIALLRGVNVGGNNKVSMPLLKKSFEEIGFLDVVTYINSGNIIFSCEEVDEEDLQSQCRRVISDVFQLNISVCVISAKDLSAAMENVPTWWGNDSESSHNAIFVIKPVDAKVLVEQNSDIKPEYENIASYGQVIFWSAPVRTFSKTRWSKVVSSSAYASVTIRNANTTRKLLQLVNPL